MTSKDRHPRNPASAAPVRNFPDEGVQPRVPAPIRADREQLEQALKPVLAAIESLGVAMRDELAPAFARMGEQLERIASAMEASELRATRRTVTRR